MKKLIVLSFAALTMLNCKKSDEKTKNPNVIQEQVTVETGTPIDLGCYVFDDGKNNGRIQ